MSFPEKLGRYRLEAELGKGAMGRVYLAHDPAIDRKVAIKTVVLPAGLSPGETEEIQARFNREVQAAGRLAHPNIVTIFDIGEEPSVGTFVAMEYVEGRTLEEYIRLETLPSPRTVASIGCQAADALAYAHREGIVHRDIKPANLILVGERTVKIADFGLAKQTGTSLTTDGAFLGTPNYMSPEQIRGQDVDGRSDLFSLAIVVYELLTGKRPFRGESISTVIYRITTEPPIEPDLGQVPDAVRIKAFLGRALSKNPDDRYQTGDEFARELRESFAGSPATLETAPAASEVSGKTATGVPASPARAAPLPAPGEQKSPRRHPRPAQHHQGRAGAKRSRGRRTISILPFLIIPLVLVGAGFIYRERLFDLLGLPVPGLDESIGQPTVPGAGEGGDREKEPAGSGGLTGSDAGPTPPPVNTLVRLRSEPEGATFFLGERPLPANRIRAPETGEELSIRAVLDCREATRDIGPEEAGQEMTFQLQPVMLSMKIVSEPQGASVRIDGKRAGKTAMTATLDSCLTHTVALSREGYEPWKRTLALERGRLQAPDTLRAEMSLLPKGVLVIPEAPYPVTVKLGGRQEVKSGRRMTVVAGLYRVEFTNKTLMFRSEVRVRVPADGTISPDIVFPPVVTLSVVAQPGNAVIEISNKSFRRTLGAPPIFNENLVAGTYDVRCRFIHNGEEQEKTVELAKGDSPRVRFVASNP